MNALPAGSVLDSGQHRYRIVKVLGQGGFGITYQAVAKIKVGNVSVDVPFAIKEHFISSYCERKGTTVTISNQSNAQEVNDSQNCFLTEAERLNRLSLEHDGLVKVNESFRANDTAYYVMEYIGGENLRQYVKRQPAGRLSEAEALPIIKKVAEAVSYLHQNQVTHLDIKPDNILLREDNSPVLIDFGLAKHYDKKGKATSTLKVAGCSDGYAPLEQYVGITRFTPQADVYALAATLLYLLTGKDPRIASEVSREQIEQSLPSDVSVATRAAIVHAMQMVTANRTASVSQFCSELSADDYTGETVVNEQAEKNNEGVVTVKRTKKQKSKWSRKTVKYAVASLLALLLLIAGIVAVTSSNDSESVYEKSSEPKNEFEGMTAQQIAEIADDYYYGRNGKTQDYAEAVKWARKAAEMGDSNGQFRLGYCYKNGLGVTQDYAEAVRWYRKAAEQGDANAQCNFGVCYEKGHGVTLDYAEAVKWYRKAAEQGNTYAQNNLGYCYKNGLGVTQDYAEAVKWYRKAADQGHAWAQYNLGLCYYNGQGVTQDYAEAVKWYRKSAEQGYTMAQCNLGWCYYNGDGVTQDYAEAVKWYRKAAEQGDANAHNNLGWCYYHGQGVTKDRDQARELWRKAAAQGDQIAKNNLKKYFRE